MDKVKAILSEAVAAVLFVAVWCGMLWIACDTSTMK